MHNSEITLVMFPRHMGVASASPFCAKLELWLKLAGIPYVIQAQTMPMKSPKKKLPFVIIDGEAMGDSTLIIEHLTKTRNIDLDNGLTDKQRGVDQAIWGMCDERLYWYIVWDRWLGSGWPVISETFFKNVPGLIRPLIKKLARGGVKKSLWLQGTGRHTPEQILNMAERDIGALAAIIGDGPYVHGDQIRTIDAVVYAYVVNLTEIKLTTPMIETARAHANLVAYARRITEQYFPELI